MNNLYDLILTKLSLGGINTPVDISSMFIDFEHPKSVADAYWHNIEGGISDYLNIMLNNKHISSFNISKNDNKSWGSVHVEATIDINGIEYIQNRMLLSETINSFKWNKHISIFAIIISIVSLIFSLFYK